MWQVIYNITKQWWDRHKGTQNPSSCLTQCQTEKKSFRQLCTRGTIQCLTRRIQNARPCVEKMQFIFFVPPNEELEGTLQPQKWRWRVHVPPDEKTCGHAEFEPMFDWIILRLSTFKIAYEDPIMSSVTIYRLFWWRKPQCNQRKPEACS